MIARANTTSDVCWLRGLAVAACCVLPAAAAEPAPRYVEHQDLGYYLDDHGRKMPVRTPADWEKRRAHVLAHMQSVMGPVPPASRRVPLATEVLEEVEVDGIRRRKISYATEAGNRVTAYLLLPGGPGDAKRPAVLCLHPTTKIGKGEPAGLGDRPDLHYALHLACRGYVTLAPDYPSFGEYRHDFAADSTYASGTMKAIWDNMRAIDLLESLPEVDGERIGCLGHSLGGHNTMFTAAFDPRIKALVSSCGFTRFHKYRGGALKGWAAGCYMPRIRTVHHENPDEMPFDFTEIVAAFAPRAFLACAPARDDNFDMSGVQDCLAAARPVYELHGAADKLQAHYPEAAHEFPALTRDVAYRFFDAHL